MYNDSTTVFVVEILKGVEEIVLIIPYPVVTTVILPCTKILKFQVSNYNWEY